MRRCLVSKRFIRWSPRASAHNSWHGMSWGIGDRWREMLGSLSSHVKTEFRSLMLSRSRSIWWTRRFGPQKRGWDFITRVIPLWPSRPRTSWEHRDQMHLHSLFSELVWEAPSEKVISTSAGLTNFEGLQAFVVTHGKVEFSKGGVTFLGGLRPYLAAHSIAGEKLIGMRDYRRYISSWVLVISGDQTAEIRRLESAIVRFTRAICMRCSR